MFEFEPLVVLVSLLFPGTVAFCVVWGIFAVWFLKKAAISEFPEHRRAIQKLVLKTGVMTFILLGIVGFSWIASMSRTTTVSGSVSPAPATGTTNVLSPQIPSNLKDGSNPQAIRRILNCDPSDIAEMSMVCDSNKKTTTTKTKDWLTSPEEREVVTTEELRHPTFRAEIRANGTLRDVSLSEPDYEAILNEWNVYFGGALMEYRIKTETTTIRNSESGGTISSSKVSL